MAELQRELMADRFKSFFSQKEGKLGIALLVFAGIIVAGVFGIAGKPILDGAVYLMKSLFTLTGWAAALGILAGGLGLIGSMLWKFRKKIVLGFEMRCYNWTNKWIEMIDEETVLRYIVSQWSQALDTIKELMPTVTQQINMVRTEKEKLEETARDLDAQIQGGAMGTIELELGVPEILSSDLRTARNMARSYGEDLISYEALKAELDQRELDARIKLREEENALRMLLQARDSANAFFSLSQAMKAILEPDATIRDIYARATQRVSSQTALRRAQVEEFLRETRPASQMNQLRNRSTALEVLRGMGKTINADGQVVPLQLAAPAVKRQDIIDVEAVPVGEMSERVPTPSAGATGARKGVYLQFMGKQPPSGGSQQ